MSIFLNQKIKIIFLLLLKVICFQMIQSNFLEVKGEIQIMTMNIST